MGGVDHIAKKFYERFKQERKAFLQFIAALESQSDRERYASLILHSLMCIYFIQKKGFLDGDDNYLRHRLGMMQECQGRDKFLSFYRHLLLRLFHEKRGQQARPSKLDALLGHIPYL